VDFVKINKNRLINNLEEIKKIGYQKNKGVNRLSLNKNDQKARKWLIKKFKNLGLSYKVDEAANLIGKLKSSKSDETNILIIGSHLDSVKNGGKYDGAAGIIAGLECISILKENNLELPWNIELINFTDEEGYHYGGTFGSRAMMGLINEKDLNMSNSKDIPTMKEDFIKINMDPNKVWNARRKKENIMGYLELHIEQGNKLYDNDKDIGIVTGIVGTFRYNIKIKGKANHAGTTSMNQRKDALINASKIFNLLPEWCKTSSEEMVGTIGKIKLFPGTINVIPGLCEFTVELRSKKCEESIRVKNRLMKWIKNNATGNVETILEKSGVSMNSKLIQNIKKSAEREKLNYIKLNSGAGHDAMSFAPYVPTGMIFIPSKNGLSHCPQEYSENEWIIKGTQTLLNTIISIV